MEVAISKFYQPDDGFCFYCDVGKCLFRNKWCARAIQQHCVISQFVPLPRWVGIKESGRPKPALLDSGRPHTGPLSSGIVNTIEGTDTNGTLMQNLVEYLITNRFHVRIYSVSRFRACHLHRYVVLLLRIRLPKSKGIASVYFRFAYTAVNAD